MVCTSKKIGELNHDSFCGLSLQVGYWVLWGRKYILFFFLVEVTALGGLTVIRSVRSIQSTSG
jgi:hypothetical protein